MGFILLVYFSKKFLFSPKRPKSKKARIIKKSPNYLIVVKIIIGKHKKFLFDATSIEKYRAMCSALFILTC